MKLNGDEDKISFHPGGEENIRSREKKKTKRKTPEFPRETDSSTRANHVGKSRQKFPLRGEKIEAELIDRVVSDSRLTRVPRPQKIQRAIVDWRDLACKGAAMWLLFPCKQMIFDLPT